MDVMGLGQNFLSTCIHVHLANFLERNITTKCWLGYQNVIDTTQKCFLQPNFFPKSIIHKLTGVIMPATPIGCFMVISLLLGAGDGIVSPHARRPSSANHSTKPAPYPISPLDSASVFP